MFDFIFVNQHRVGYSPINQTYFEPETIKPKFYSLQQLTLDNFMETLRLLRQLKKIICPVYWQEITISISFDKLCPASRDIHQYH